MNKTLTICLLSCVLPAATAWARGGGGCLEEGTAIETPSGPVAIERLRPGDAVWSVRAEGLRAARVQAVFRVEPEEYVDLRVAGTAVRVTGEHPIEAEPGVFRAAGTVRAGDTVIAWRDGRPEALRVESAGRVRSSRSAYNLLVSPGGTYVANGIVVHNKGCFLPDTPILLADGGAVAISAVRAGDVVLAVAPDGNVTRAVVRDTLRAEVEEYAEVVTERRMLRVTPDHPFYAGDGTFRTLESLRVGDRVWAFDGRGLSPERIVSIRREAGRITVHNLQTDAPHTFFAAGIAVHNKGGGCFPPGTAIRTPSGERLIERLSPGETVLAVAKDGRLVPARVRAVFETTSALLKVHTDGGDLVTTAEHPLALPGGGFRAAGALAPGEEVLLCRAERPVRARVLWARQEEGERRVLNLQVDEPHTFIAGGFVVHNKGGGCFPLGTAVETIAGAVAIESLSPGAAVIGVTLEGELVSAKVRAVYEAASVLLTVHTTGGDLVTTAEHPLALARGGFRPAGELAAGEEVLLLRDGRVVRAEVLWTREEPGLQRVLNLEVDEPHTFVAGGFVVHNKGFSGGHYSGGRSSGTSSTGPASLAEAMPFIVFGGFVLCVCIVCIVRSRSRSQQNLDYCYTRDQISRKEGKTRKLLEFIGGTDPTVQPAKLQAHAQEVFVTLQKCWAERDYAPMRPLLTPDLYGQHLGQLAGMARNHEINMIAGLQVEQVDLVNVRYTDKPDGREYTALITARARDYYVDDRTRVFLRGDTEPARFQEFWTFELRGGRWLLREIEQTRESDALKEENFFESFTDRNVAQVYGKEAGQAGPVGPWQESATASKGDRIDRLLNFLVRTDKLWDRTAMVERARQVYLNVMLAREAGEASAVKDDDLFPEPADSLRKLIAAWKERGLRQEYRNLCVRKAELVLVRNYSDNARDEYTVRISAHAQQVVTQGARVVRQDADVSPILEFWTFGRRDGKWKLKEVLPPGKGEEAIREENLDEDSSPAQLQWYYRQTRAV